MPQTADVGLTESTGDNGLRFEVWFRRRTSKNQTFILQAATADVKHTWTADIARILWNQATRNKGKDGSSRGGGAPACHALTSLPVRVCFRDASEGDGVYGSGQQTVSGHPAERRRHQ